jgi:hypothetical protein
LHKARPPLSHQTSVQKRGIGIYSYNQIKNTRPIGRIGAMFVGGIYALVGVGIIVRLFTLRRAEVRVWGSPEPHWVGFVFGICLVCIGAFLAHVGVIYWRKLRLRGSGRDPLHS